MLNPTSPAAPAHRSSTSLALEPTSAQQLAAQIDALTARFDALAARADTSFAVMQLAVHFDALTARLTTQEQWCRESAARMASMDQFYRIHINELTRQLGEHTQRSQQLSSALTAQVAARDSNHQELKAQIAALTAQMARQEAQLDKQTTLLQDQQDQHAKQLAEQTALLQEQQDLVQTHESALETANGDIHY